MATVAYKAPWSTLTCCSPLKLCCSLCATQIRQAPAPEPCPCSPSAWKCLGTEAPARSPYCLPVTFLAKALLPDHSTPHCLPFLCSGFCFLCGAHQLLAFYIMYLHCFWSVTLTKSQFHETGSLCLFSPLQ